MKSSLNKIPMKKIIFVALLWNILIFSAYAQKPSKETQQKKKKNFEVLTDELLAKKIDSVSYLQQIQLLDQVDVRSTEATLSTTAFTTMSAGTVYFVNATASGGSGLTWGTAFNNLQTALSVATAGDEIWVAKGTYKPTTNTQRTISFALKTDVSLFGGFTGNESAKEQRNWIANATILSGEIGGTAVTDNSDHVVTASSVTDVVLDGFIVEKGYASSSYGGGIFCSSVNNLTVENCTFRNNWSRYHGGAVYLLNTGGNVINSVFYDNTAHLYDGGGYFASGGVAKTIVGCLFYDNQAGRAGGAIEAYSQANLVILNTTVSGNLAASFGNEVSSWGGATSLRNSLVYANTASPSTLATPGGGSIYAYYSIVQHGGYIPGAGVIDTDPLFVNAGAKNFRLQASSAGVDSGTPDVSGLPLPLKDLDGEIRIKRNHIDMGAYEEGEVDGPLIPNAPANLVQNRPNDETAP